MIFKNLKSINHRTLRMLNFSFKNDEVNLYSKIKYIVFDKSSQSLDDFFLKHSNFMILTFMQVLCLDEFTKNAKSRQKFVKIDFEGVSIMLIFTKNEKLRRTCEKKTFD